jgi:PAS domain S-box-containing protein
MAHEITESDDQWRTDEALRESEHRFRQLAENIQHVFYLADAVVLQQLYISPAYETIWGRSCQSLRDDPTSFIDAIHPTDRQRMVEALPRKAREEVEVIYRIVQPNGAIRWIQDRSVPVRDASGQLYRIAGIALDITELKQAQEALQKQQREQEHILDSVPAMIWYKDAENRILRVNKPAADLMNLPVEEIEGRSTYEIYPEEAAQYHRDDLEVIHSGRPKRGIVELLQTASGEKRWVKTDKIPYQDAEGNMVGVIVFAVDITDLKRAEEELQRARAELETRVAERTVELAKANEDLRKSNRRLAAALNELKRMQTKLLEQERLRALGEMASGIAHDFNNSLSPILGFSDLLLTRPDLLDDPERRSEYLQLIYTAADDASRVVQGLRDSYGKREAGALSAAVDLNTLMDGVITFTQPKWRDQALASGAMIDIQRDLGEVPPVRGDESELREAFTNLIFNAVDAMPRGGTLTLRTRLDGAQAVVEVEDTGSGMTDEVRSHCLEPFFTTKGDRGTGMGLAMAHSIIQRHEGRLDIETNLGRGTRFLVRLPVHVQPADEAPQPSIAAPTRPLRILVVDDEPMVREVLTAILEADGHCVQEATHGREGLERFCAGEYDLVVIDRAMPELNGDQLAVAIKQRVPGTPVILLTGFGDLMNATGDRPAGVDLVLPKPITLTALRQAVATVTAS